MALKWEVGRTPVREAVRSVAANDSNRIAIALSEHLAILEALCKSEKNIARQLLEDHLRSSTPILQELLKKQQENP